MKKWLKRIRGALGMGLTWAAAWAFVGTGLMVVWGLVGMLTGGLGGPTGWNLLLDLVFFAGFFALGGFVVGAGFSVALGIAEGRRRFDEMSVPRFASWGAVGGLFLSLTPLSSGQGSVLEHVLFVGVLALMGAGSAAGSLALARRADDRELLEDGADVADIGLTEKEAHELLGTQRAGQSPLHRIVSSTAPASSSIQSGRHLCRRSDASLTPLLRLRTTWGYERRTSA